MKKIGWLFKVAGAAAAGVCVALMLERGSFAGCVANAALYYSILYLAYRFGAGTGAVAGTACGIIFAVLQNDVAALGILCLIGALAGAFRRLGKYGSSVGFLAGACGACFIYSPVSLDEIITGIVFAVALFMLTPAKLCSKAGSREKKSKKDDFSGKEQVFTERLHNMSKIMGDVVKYISYTGNNVAVTPAVTAAVMCNISSVICENCEGCVMGCADNSFDSVVLDNISNIYESRGKITENDIEGFFDSECVNRDIYIDELNIGLGSVVERREWEQRCTESRKTVVSGYREMEGFLEKMADDFGKINDFTAEAAGDILESIGKGMIIKELAAIEGPYGREVYMTAATRGKSCQTAGGLAAKVGKALEGSFMPAEECVPVIGRKPVRLKFIEDNDYLLLFGMARERKKGESISGDNFAQMNLMGQKMFIGLSDGMGSGKSASEHSKIAIGMAEKLLENGFSAEQVSRTVNSVLLLQEDEQPTTLDMSVIDMKNAIMKVVKLGAAPTFIKRGNTVDIIQATSLPAGVVDDFGGSVIDVGLKDGDIIIMMTDGVLDAIEDDDKDGVMRDIILDIDTENPKDISNRILSLVKPADGAADDMTVLAAGIWRK